MKIYTLGLIFLVAAGLLACDPQSRPTEQLPAETVAALQQKTLLIKKIDSSEAIIRHDVRNARNPDAQLAFDAYNLYSDFAKKYPADSLTPVYLFNMAQLQGGVLENPEKAADIYEGIWNNYPNYKQRPEALFFAANSLHDSGDTTAAIELFNKFAAYHRFHPFADDAKGLVKMLSMNKQELKAFLSEK